MYRVFRTVCAYHMLHSARGWFRGTDMQSEPFRPVPREHGKLSADERVERVCFGFGPERL